MILLWISIIPILLPGLTHADCFTTAAKSAAACLSSISCPMTPALIQISFQSCQQQFVAATAPVQCPKTLMTTPATTATVVKAMIAGGEIDACGGGVVAPADKLSEAILSQIAADAVPGVATKTITDDASDGSSSDLNLIDPKVIEKQVAETAVKPDPPKKKKKTFGGFLKNVVNKAVEASTAVAGAALQASPVGAAVNGILPSKLKPTNLLNKVGSIGKRKPAAAAVAAAAAAADDDNDAEQPPPKKAKTSAEPPAQDTVLAVPAISSTGQQVLIPAAASPVKVAVPALTEKHVVVAPEAVVTPVQGPILGQMVIPSNQIQRIPSDGGVAVAQSAPMNVGQSTTTTTTIVKVSGDEGESKKQQNGELVKSTSERGMVVDDPVAIVKKMDRLFKSDADRASQPYPEPKASSSSETLLISKGEEKNGTNWILIGIAAAAGVVIVAAVAFTLVHVRSG